MKRFTIASFLIVFTLNANSQQAQRSVSIIPQPVSMETGKGNFTLNTTSVIELSASDADAKRVADFLAKKLSGATGYIVPVRSVSSIF